MRTRDTPRAGLATARITRSTLSDNDDRTGRQSANLSRHLNGQHPSTLLMLARHAPGGRPDATGADDHGLTVKAATPEGDVVLRLALPDGPTSADGSPRC